MIIIHIILNGIFFFGVKWLCHLLFQFLGCDFLLTISPAEKVQLELYAVLLKK